MADGAAVEKAALAPGLVDARGAASFCGVSRAHWMAMHSAGRVPLPIHLGRRRLWSVADLGNWIAADCPERADWEALKVVRK